MNARCTTAFASRLALVVSLAVPAIAHAIDPGDASVLSQQGQRLKVVVPFGSAPGEHVPVSRFSIASVSVPEGHAVPNASQFVISMPERRNVVYLQSREPVNAPSVQLVLAIANSDTERVAYDLVVPPPVYAVSQASEERPTPVKRRPAKRTARAK